MSEKKDTTQHEIPQSRIIGDIKGAHPGPMVIFIGSIHGNEPAGSMALQEVFTALENKRGKMHGRAVALTGNLKALRQGKRYLEEDLNRLWTKDNIELLMKGGMRASEGPEYAEMVGLFNLLDDFLNEGYGNYFFIDLHTTSAPTVPFITMNDSLLNRQYCKNFPVPIVMGIEEVLQGTLLSYLNEIGFVGFGFEAGQHEDGNAFQRHFSFIWSSLVFAGILNRAEVPGFEKYIAFLKEGGNGNRFYEIKMRYQVNPEEGFEMVPGYSNFQAVKKDEVLANNHSGNILSSLKGRIFMPLYQSQGEDGFFLVDTVHPFWLKLSKYIRTWRLDRLMVLLPGVRRNPRNYFSLLVDLRWARFYSDQIFHLLGYRKKQLSGNKVMYTQRDFPLRTKG